MHKRHCHLFSFDALLSAWPPHYRITTHLQHRRLVCLLALRQADGLLAGARGAVRQQLVHLSGGRRGDMISVDGRWGGLRSQSHTSVVCLSFDKCTPQGASAATGLIAGVATARPCIQQSAKPSQAPAMLVCLACAALEYSWREM